MRLDLKTCDAKALWSAGYGGVGEAEGGAADSSLGLNYEDDPRRNIPWVHKDAILVPL